MGDTRDRLELEWKKERDRMASRIMRALDGEMLTHDIADAIGEDIKRTWKALDYMRSQGKVASRKHTEFGTCWWRKV